jgi:transcriptional regulator of aromatic amino acid metabolism
MLIPISLFSAISKMQTDKVPRIIKQQLKIFILALIVPHEISDCLQVYPFNFAPNFIASTFAFVGISTMLLTIAIYYSMRKVMGLRFLSFKTHVAQPEPRYNFVDNFKIVLDQLSRVTNMKELEHIAKSFFKEGFGVPLNRMQLFIRTPERFTQEIAPTPGSIEVISENFLNACNQEIKQYIKANKIFIYDEIAFSNFYEENDTRQIILGFMEGIHADLFLPIFQQDTVIAYIEIDRHARQSHQFYSDVERDEMLVFAQYIGNIINLLQQRNLEELILREKDLREELYSKHQEINQYKESIKSFLKNNEQKEIGIIFYKNRRFTFGNQTAKEMININVNQLAGHPITKKLKYITTLVEEYRTSQRAFTIDTMGNKLIICAVPHLDQNNVIIMAYYPEVVDIIKKQIDLLKDPTKWDYLLYLETTKSGKLINQLIPGSGETLLNFKIHLLKVALSTKATLLEMPENDLLATAEILHHISLRENLHLFKLKGPLRNNDVAIKLFGINPMFGMSPQKPLLERIGPQDTLFIQDIHFLDLETQEYLTELIKYGFYRMLKSDKKIHCSVRIVCSTNHDLNKLVQEGTFSPILFNELKKTVIILPSLLSLPDQEVNDLADAFTEQAIKNKEIKELFELTPKDRNRLIHNRPISLFEFKNKVQQLLKQKSDNKHLPLETEFDPAYSISDPELIEAARLGKNALRDQKTMVLLWSKFDKNQNKIADFLGVNRSSVNRRCKKYNLY